MKKIFDLDEETSVNNGLRDLQAINRLQKRMQAIIKKAFDLLLIIISKISRYIKKG